MRKLVSLRVVDCIENIDGADNMQLARIGGWSVVVKKGEFKAGDVGVYHEIDSWLPASNLDYSFLMAKEGKENRVFDGISGERLKTKKLRGVVSQGLLMPLSILMEADLSECLGVTKWEKYISQSCNQGNAKGNFPYFIPKTDQERCQNLKKEIGKWSIEGDEWEITEKLDGSSMTAFVNGGVFGVCSRNLELKRDELSVFWKAADKYKIEESLCSLNCNIAIQGELT